MSRVFVTGVGIITSLGMNYAENLQLLRETKGGIRKSEFFSSRFAETHQFGEIPHSTDALKSMLPEYVWDKGMTRTDILAFHAFLEAVQSAGLQTEEMVSRQTAFISASTVGGMCAHDDLIHDVKLPANPSDNLFSYPFSAHTFKIINKFGIKGISDTINTACSSSANAIISGVKLIKAGRAKRVIAGGVDSLSKFTVNGFNALRILSEEPCRPFDVNRKGLTLGEGAAYVVLENEEISANKFRYAEIVGYANASDAYHQSSLSENAVGVIKVMAEAIAMAGIAPQDVDYINTHGTATENNDAVELYGMKQVFGKIPAFHSSKSYIGHTLGAAGAVEAVMSIMSIVNDELYASLNCDEPIENIWPVSSYIPGFSVRYVLSNSFGFGGNCTSILLSKAKN